MRRYVLGTAMLLIAAAFPLGARGNDEQIAQQIVETLQQHKEAGALKGFNVELEVEGGVVMLGGAVASAEQKRLVMESANDVPGVNQVVDNMTVTGSSRRTAAMFAPARSNAPVEIAPAAAQRSVLRQEAQGTGVSEDDVAYAYDAPARTAARPLPPAVAPRGVPQAYPQMVSGRPVAFAAAGYQVEGSAVPPAPGMAAPAYVPGGMAPGGARYDHPVMPNYSWPAYAAYPNYAGVTYPRQYSPTVWPYIGPFYPYPQVPLGWRKVTLEWDDGWWFLDFQNQP